MKGGKEGRKKAAGKAAEPVAPRRSAARGAPKRDWGAIPLDRDEPAAPVKPSRDVKGKAPKR